MGVGQSSCGEWEGLAGVVGDRGELVTQGICGESSDRPRMGSRKTQESWVLQRAVVGCVDAGAGCSSP